MRFISPIGAYRIVAIHDKTVPHPDGYTHTVEAGYAVEFRQGLLTPFERKLAKERLQWPGGVIDRRNMDGSPYDMVGMAGVWDSEWIEDKALRTRVEKILLANPGCGVATDYILVEQPRQPVPWASYDQLTVHGRRSADHVAEKNLEIAAVTGVQIEDMIAYETENRADERILALYEQAVAARDAGEPAPELIQA